MIRSPVEWKLPTISAGLLAAAVAVPLAVLAPAPAEARQKGTAYAESGHDGDPDRLYRRGVALRNRPYGAHKRLSKDYIRWLALKPYPAILRIECRDGIYDVWAHDYYGRTFRLAYDAYTGIFLTLVFLGILG